MEKPHSFAGKVIRRGGKQSFNDYTADNKFFADMSSFDAILGAVPFSAIQDLEKYDLNRDVIMRVMEKLFSICSAAKIDIIKEMDRLDASPFDGLEEDLAMKKKPYSQEN